MKKPIAFTGIILCAMIFIPGVNAQQAGVNGQSMNGSSGLFAIPSGRIGWENAGNLALDFGYRAVINNDSGVSHIPALTVSLFKFVELSTAFDFQPAYDFANDKENGDLLMGIKFKLPPAGNTSIAIGGNIQLINFSNDNHSYNAYQPYIAITYPGNFFSMTAETTIVFGKTFYSGGPDIDSSIDFGMGFDLVLFPDVFGNAVHWIIDFANFSYSDNSWPHNSYQHTNAWWRGVLNTGIRIDLSAFPALSEFKFLIDVVFNDLFDDGARSFTVGAVFGFSAL
jgi:hypothetical protein